MQTSFTLAQLADPDLADADSILRACVHCGFCLATCPTYVVLGDELDSPRGRLYLTKNMLESGAPATKTEATHLDRCLTCLSCMTTCPASVHYMHLIDHGRAHIARTYRRPFSETWLRNLLNAILPHQTRFRWALRLSRLIYPVRALMPKRLQALLDLAHDSPIAPRSHKAGTYVAPGPRIRRVALLDGCVQPVLRPQINEAAIRLLNRRGVDVVMPPKAGCCGALSHHLSDDETALRLARADIDAWIREIDGDGLDAIVVTASGCGTMIKDYGHLLRNDPSYARKAARISALAKDVSEVLAEIGLGTTEDVPKLAVAYHAACSLQHGQRVHAPRALLRAIGFDVRDIDEGHLCCGSAGIYNMLEPELSASLLARKAANIEHTGAALIATGNIGCITQIARATQLPIVHTVELLDWATGGPQPREIIEIMKKACAEPA